MQRVAGPAAKFCAGSSTKGLSLASACQIASPGSETETRCRGCKGIKLRKVKFDFDAEKISLEDVEKAITALGYEVIKSQVKAK